MSIAKAVIVQSTIYPDKKSIRPRDSWESGRVIRDLFADFDVGENVVIISEDFYQDLMEASKSAASE